jgi:Class III cytochrome C family
MYRIGRNLIYFLVACLVGISSFNISWAQEDVYRLENTDIFGILRRPAVEFQHDVHIDALEDNGCGACHHAPDAGTGKLVYVEDEEGSCSECHGAKEQENVPALREAFHGSCTGCHRQMGKAEDAFKGPTTCGECHSAK